MASSDNYEDTLELVAPTAGVVAGTCIRIGGIVCLPLLTAAATVAFPAKTTGRIKAATAATAAWVAGDKLYWDNAAAAFTKTATGNTACGYAAAIKASATLTGDVLLINGL